MSRRQVLLMSRRARYLVAVLFSFALLSGCSWFGSDDEPEEVQPNPLPKINKEVDVKILWTQSIGNGADDRAIKLKVAAYGGRIFAAAADGHVKALQPADGRIIWQQNVKNFYTKEELNNAFTKNLDTITGGVGAGGDLLVVGTASGEVLALHQSDGSLAWKTSSSSEVLSAPQVDDDLVIVQSIDGKVAAYDAIDGSRRWIYSTSVPALTLRGTAHPIIENELVIAGFANSKIAFLERDTGLAKFEQRVMVSEGNSDLERLVDIDGNMEVLNNVLYVASFQGRFVAIDIAGGRMLWVKEASSLAGIGSGFGNLYLAHADSQLASYNAATGSEVWSVDALLNRDITRPVASGSYVAVTDYEGYIHLLAQSDGRFVGRRKLDGNGIQGGLVAGDGRLYSMGDGGKLSALEIR